MVLKKLDPTQQKEIDGFLLQLDGTENKCLMVYKRLCKAGVVHKCVQLYKYIAELAGSRLAGTCHECYQYAGNKLAMQIELVVY
uniref:Uncharacterized protein n=1 Tax=Wuchereria bancrofti TaxID=6293 RepID=A0A1I8EYU2_WUCBA